MFDFLKKKPKEQPGHTDVTDVTTENQILGALMKLGVDASFLQDEKFRSVPELMSGAGERSMEVWKRIQHMIRDDDQHQNSLRLAIVWCLYLGMGNTAQWYADQSRLRSQNFIDACAREHGLERLDEYVTDLIGVRWGSTESDKLRIHVFGARDVMNKLIDSAKPADKQQQIRECLKAAYDYGMTLEMSRLGC